jgi:hypothetical protein
VDVHVRELARAHTEAAILALVDVATNPEQRGSDRTAAAVALLDRGWGRPTERVEPEVAVEAVAPDEQAERVEAAKEILRQLFPLAEEGLAIETGAPVEG